MPNLSKFLTKNAGKRMKWLASLLVHEAKRRSQPDVGNLGIGRNPSYGSWFAILGMDAKESSWRKTNVCDKPSQKGSRISQRRFPRSGCTTHTKPQNNLKP